MEQLLGSQVQNLTSDRGNGKTKQLHVEGDFPTFAAGDAKQEKSLQLAAAPSQRRAVRSAHAATRERGSEIAGNCDGSIRGAWQTATCSGAGRHTTTSLFAGIKSPDRNQLVWNQQ